MLAGLGEKAELNPNTGLPNLTEEDKEKAANSDKFKSVFYPIVSTLIGTGIAFLIYRFGSKDKYDAKIQAAKAFDASWLILALIIFSFVVNWLNMYPMRFKERFMGGYSAGNLRANPLIYQFATMRADESPVVILSDKEEVGSYNRANRSLHHLLETGIPFIMSTVVTFYLLPFPTFVILLLFCIGRILHQMGYAG